MTKKTKDGQSDKNSGGKTPKTIPTRELTELEKLHLQRRQLAQKIGESIYLIDSYKIQISQVDNKLQQLEVQKTLELGLKAKQEAGGENGK